MYKENSKVKSLGNTNYRRGGGAIEETDSYAKDHIKIFKDISNVLCNLDRSSIALLMILISYVSPTGMLKIKRGNALDNSRIAEISNLSNKTVGRSLTQLVKNNVLFRVNVGKSHNYITNQQYIRHGEKQLSRWRKQHAAYLRTIQWKLKRKLILARDNNRCQHCNSKKFLQVHHLTYDNFMNEPLEDLVTLCKHCHSRIHNKRRR